METKKAVRSGQIQLGDIKIKCHVTQDGERIIEEQSVVDFLNYLQLGKITKAMAEQFAKELNEL